MGNKIMDSVLVVLSTEVIRNQRQVELLKYVDRWLYAIVWASALIIIAKMFIDACIATDWISSKKQIEYEAKKNEVALLDKKKEYIQLQTLLKNYKEIDRILNDNSIGDETKNFIRNAMIKQV